MSKHDEFGDSEAKRIIARAAEIDAERGQRLDANALREIASEAGISPAAVDQAIRERLVQPPMQRSWVARHPGILITIAIIAAVLFVRMIVPPG